MQIGDHPQVQYFTGKSEIFSCDLADGKFEVRHRFGQSLGGVGGVEMSNRIYASFQFNQPSNFRFALSQIYKVSQLFSLAVGRPQNIENIRLQETGAEPGSSFQVIVSVPEVFEKITNSIKPGPRDSLLDGIKRPDELSKVLRYWLSDSAKLSASRARLWGSFKKQNFFDVDRMIAAANAFDTIPADYFPEPPMLDRELVRQIDEALTQFKKLPKSEERASIVRDLSRIKRHTLRSKIKHWAKELLETPGSGFKDIDFVIGHSVQCRNFFVHGGDAAFDYDKDLNLFSFLIRTLEFCFVIPELKRCGWQENLNGHHHPFGDYAFYYPSNLEKLRLAISSSQNVDG